MSRRAIFLDVDGVMLDPERTSAEWVRLMGEVLAPALGGTPEEWGRANAKVFPRVFADRASWYRPDPEVSERLLITMMFREECALLELAAPSDEEAFRLGRELDVHVSHHTRAAFPATVEVIRNLALSFELHTATGNPSWRVEPMLEQWGVRDLFGVLPGGDLVGVMKGAEAFYPSVFALAGVEASEAVVVDDHNDMLLSARALGARTVLIGDGRGQRADVEPGTAGADLVIANIEELPAALRRLG